MNNDQENKSLNLSTAGTIQLGGEFMDKIFESFSSVEVATKTTKGDFFIGGVPKAAMPGIAFLIFPTRDMLDPDVSDVFYTGLRQSSIRQVLECFNQEIIYKTRDDFTRISIESGELNLSFRYRHLLDTWATFNVDSDTTQVVLEWLAYHSGTARNSRCPCKSGKKFKVCCARRDPVPVVFPGFARDRSALPQGLEWIDETGIEELQYFVHSAIDDPSTLQDPEFWAYMGATAGTRGYHEKAMDCFIKALELDPGLHGAKLNLAAELSQLDKLDEALALIDEIPIATNRRSVILANILSDRGDDLQAIPHYEKAIAEEPDFWLPYARLISILERHGHPLYEFWVTQAAKMLPSSPWTALQYTRYLWGERRFDELAKATWVEKVKLEVDYSIIGLSDNAQEAETAKLRHRAAIAVLNPDRPLLKNLADQIAIIDSSQHLCDEAKTLAIICVQAGLPEFIPQFYGRVCHLCTDEGIGITRSVEVLIAGAHLVLRDYEETIRYCEMVLTKDPSSGEGLHQYYWALDEVGRSDEAITVAKALYENDPSLPHLAHNLGLMSQHNGRLGEAQYYYERQQELGTHPHALKALAFLLLLQKRLDAATDHFQEWIDFVSDQDRWQEFYGPQAWVFDTGTLREVQSGPVHSQQFPEHGSGSWKSLISDELEEQNRAFEELLSFAKTNISSSTYAKDLMEKNTSLGRLQIGPDSKMFVETYSIDKVLDAKNHGEDESTYQARFLFELERHGDYSVFHASLSEQIPRFEALPLEAQKSLLEGERRLISETPMLDYSTVAISFAKATEISLLQLVFIPYKKECDVKLNISREIQLALETKRSQAGSLLRFLEKGLHLELGSMAHLLRLCSGRTAQREVLVGVLRDWITQRFGVTTLLDKENIDSLATIADKFRNPAAHSDILTKADAQTCRILCVDALNTLLG